MRFTLPTRQILALAACAALSLGAAGCAGDEASSSAPQATPPDPAAPAPDQGLPLTELPVAEKDPAGSCPYLDTQWVAETNGQKVTAVGTDDRFDTPACVFWSYPEAPQLTVLVRHTGSQDDAVAVVDWATPIEFTEPADDPAGWNGGRHGGGAVPGREGAAYSVFKGPVAVTVFTNQNESVKAQTVAEQAISALGL